jgi:hypothetical protein
MLRNAGSPIRSKRRGGVRVRLCVSISVRPLCLGAPDAPRKRDRRVLSTWRAPGVLAQRALQARTHRGPPTAPLQAAPQYPGPEGAPWVPLVLQQSSPTPGTTECREIPAPRRREAGLYPSGAESGADSDPRRRGQGRGCGRGWGAPRGPEWLGGGVLGGGDWGWPRDLAELGVGD